MLKTHRDFIESLTLGGSTPLGVTRPEPLFFVELWSAAAAFVRGKPVLKVKKPKKQ